VKDNSQAETLHILHDNPEVILPQETVNVVDNIRMTRRMHDKNLVDDQVLLRLLVKVHLLDGDRQVGADLICGVHASTGTLANFGKIAIEACQVSISANGLEMLNNVLSIHGVLLLLPQAWGCLPSGVLTLEFGNCRSWASRSTRRGALAGAGALASGRSRHDVGCVWRARTHCSSVGRASFILCCAGCLMSGTVELCSHCVLAHTSWSIVVGDLGRAWAEFEGLSKGRRVLGGVGAGQ